MSLHRPKSASARKSTRSLGDSCRGRNRLRRVWLVAKIPEIVMQTGRHQRHDDGFPASSSAAATTAAATTTAAEPNLPRGGDARPGAGRRKRAPGPDRLPNHRRTSIWARIGRRHRTRPWRRRRRRKPHRQQIQSFGQQVRLVCRQSPIVDPRGPQPQFRHPQRHPEPPGPHLGGL
jgi:hypothetical protein